MKTGRLLARAVVGGLFIGHGTQKWFGWFGGPGIEGASKMMESLGLRPDVVTGSPRVPPRRSAAG